MSTVMQNLVVLMDPPVYAHDISSKAGNMYLNRFCIDEDAAFESSGVYYLQKWNEETWGTYDEEKGKEYLFEHHTDFFNLSYEFACIFKITLKRTF